MPRLENTALRQKHDGMLVNDAGFTIEHVLMEEDAFTYALEKQGTKYLMVLFRSGNSIVPSISAVDERFVTSLLERQQREKRIILTRWTIELQDQNGSAGLETIGFMTWHPRTFQGRTFLEAYRCKESYELFLAAAAAYNAREEDLWEPLLSQTCEFHDGSQHVKGKEQVKARLYSMGDTVQSLYFGYRAVGRMQFQPMLFSPEKRFGLVCSTKEDGSAIQEIRPLPGITERNVVREMTIRTSHPLVPPVSLYIAKSQVARCPDTRDLAIDITLAFLDDDLQKRIQQRRFVVSNHYEQDGTSKTRTYVKRTWTHEMVDHAWVDDSGDLRFPNGERLSPFWIHGNCPRIDGSGKLSNHGLMV